VIPGAGHTASAEFPAMGTAVGVTAHAATAHGVTAAESLPQARALVEALEAIWSRFRPTSDVGRLNRAEGAPVAVDPRTDALLRQAKRLAALSGGAYDPTLGRLVQAWEQAAPAPPEPSALVAALATRGPDRLEPVGGVGRDGRDPDAPPRWRLTGDAQLDLGGLAKGQTADAVRDLLRSNGAASALVTLGTSSVAVWGRHPGGRPWRVGLAAVGAAAGQVIGHLELIAGSLSTSSNALRAGGAGPGGPSRPAAALAARDVLNPDTGRPADSGVGAVSVVAAAGAAAEAYSTAILVRGAEWALDQYQALACGPDAFEAVIQDRDAVLVTPGLRGRFHPARPTQVNTSS
jgi:thiamine biosynthesis lipoprotein